jgi:hypothetical protein
MQLIKIYIKSKTIRNGVYFAYCKIDPLQQEADSIEKAKLIVR